LLKPFSVLVAGIVALLLASCASSEHAAGPSRLASKTTTETIPVDFVVQVVFQSFVIRLVRDDQIAIARARVNKFQKQGIVSGKLLAGDGGFNRDPNNSKKWSWRLDPESIHFPQWSMEVCDGKPSDVEENVDHWVNDIKMYCPWSAQIIRELPAVESHSR
jgi:hypothetical protein